MSPYHCNTRLRSSAILDCSHDASYSIWYKARITYTSTARQCQMAGSRARRLHVSFGTSTQALLRLHLGPTTEKHAQILTGRSSLFRRLELRDRLSSAPAASRSPQNPSAAVALEHAAWDHPDHRQRAQPHKPVLARYAPVHNTHGMWLRDIFLLAQCAPAPRSLARSRSR